MFILSRPEQSLNVMFETLCLVFIVAFVFNSLYSDGMSHTDKYNKDGIAHYIF